MDGFVCCSRIRFVANEGPRVQLEGAGEEEADEEEGGGTEKRARVGAKDGEGINKWE